MSSPGPFDRVWAVLRDSALRPGPAVGYLVLLALAWPAYRLWSTVPPPALRAPAAVPAVVAPAPGEPVIHLPATGAALLRVPLVRLAGRPASVALRAGDRELWSRPLRTSVPAGADTFDVLLDAAAFAGPNGRTIVFLDFAGAIVGRFELASD